MESPADAMRKLTKLPPNKKCADCQTKLPQCVNLTVGSFICLTCSGIHREINSKIKSLGHSTFTDQEVEMMKQTGNDKVNAMWLARYDPQNERNRMNRQPDGNQNQNHLRTWIRRKYNDKHWYSSDGSAGSAGSGGVSAPTPPSPSSRGGSGGGRNNQPQPTVVQIPPANNPPVDLFASPAPAPVATNTANNNDGSWAAFGGSTQPQQQQQQQQSNSDPFAQPPQQQQSNSDPFAQPPQQQQNQNFANFGGGQTQQPPQQQQPSQGGFADFNQQQPPVPTQQQQQQMPVAQQGGGFTANFNQQQPPVPPQQQQQQMPAVAQQGGGFTANFNQQQTQVAPVVAQQGGGFTANFDQQQAQAPPPQQQQQLPVVVQQGGGFTANFNQQNQQQQMMQPPQQLQQPQNQQNQSFGNFNQQNQNPGASSGQMVPPQQQQQQQPQGGQDPFGNMPPPSQGGICLQPQQPTMTTNGQQPQQQSQDAFSNMPPPSQGNMGGQPQQSQAQLQTPSVMPVEKEDTMDAFAHLSVGNNGSNNNNVAGGMGGSALPMNQPGTGIVVPTETAAANKTVLVLEYKEMEMVCYKSNGTRQKAQIVKRHLDDELQPFYTIAVLGKEKQTDVHHLEPLDPSYEKIESTLISLSATQLKQVEAFLGSIVNNTNSSSNTPAIPSAVVQQPVVQVAPIAETPMTNGQVPPSIVSRSQSAMSHVSNLTQQHGPGMGGVMGPPATTMMNG
ncbi:MAG: hypothetical protein ACI8RD_001741, partial [Bacillariaceae sp.]